MSLRGCSEIFFFFFFFFLGGGLRFGADEFLE